MTTTFRTLGVPYPLVEVLDAQGKTEAFPIQVDTLPDTLAGRDVLGRGKTGSGKTLAFAIPMVARLGTRLSGGPRRKGAPLGMVLAPTRELATQINAVLEPLAKAYGLTTTTIFGGVSQHRQVQALNAGVDIIVACPGRLEDLMKQRLVTLDAVEITVLDEADHMADLGFLPGVTRIMKATPSDGQRLLFSATLDNGVDKLVKQFLHTPTTHSVDEANSPVAAMTHHVFEVAGVEEKKRLVSTLASGSGRRILFMRTKHQAKKLAKQLTADGIPAVDLHGNLSQPARDRNLAAFGDGSVRVLVATDVAARGVHVDDIELVIHVDPPMEHKAYLHRSGRTARAGAAGDVVTLVLPEQRRDTAMLLRKAAIQVQPQQVTASSEAVTRLTGEVAAPVAFADLPSVLRPPVQGGGRSQGANAQRKRAGREGESGGAGRGAQRGGSRRGGSSRGGSARTDSGRSADAGRTRGDVAPARAAAPRHSDAPAAPRARQGSRRASSTGGSSGGIRVGQVVRSNTTGGQRRGR
ncbi:MAG: DEAD/DEAH box helicase [Microcella sp.]|uniref:DEAD/DEAH box helicase n=1 Tax=Microcella sp. TaxID=1913979 RepID=UPI003314EF2A